uniref:Integrase, catalytic region, zinc finger, CCHC-type, peptidase aspartic, catalytic n=1 Tax=Tanacetum cinerariifolium TaxID=118510 RepID=A0A6L2NEQ4_TANCI|nr:integrase, catalytic region, zinc finger, CCHC-type, peptidase aspartic, catalytic [Tanacetum cinerariifolium]
MVADLRYFKSLELEVDSLKSQLETQKTQFLNEIDRLSWEYYYADHMNAILGVYTELDEVSNLQCDYLETLEKCECLEKELSKSKIMSNSFEALQKHTINLELELHQCKKDKKNDKSFKENQSKDFRKKREQYFEIQDLKAQLQDKGIAISELKKLIEKLKGKSVETNLKAKTLNVNFVCVTCGKCVLNDNHDKCVLHYLNGVNFRTKMPIAVPISTIEPKRIVNQSVATPLKRTVASESTNQKPRHTTRKLYESVSKTCILWYPKFTPPRYKWKPKSQIGNVNLNVSMPLGNASRTANILEPMTPRCSNVLNNTLYSNSFATHRDNPIHRTVKFGNDQIALLLGYGDLVQGTVTIKRGNDLLTGSRGTDLYSITLQDTSSPNLIFLMTKATSSQAWLWYRHLSHLNFDTINLLLKNDIVIGLPKSVKFFHIFGSLCYIVRDGENLDKMKEKGDACIFVGYSTQSRAFRVFNKRTKVIVETIHVNFDELPQMASDHISSDPVPQCPITSIEHDSLSPGPQCQENVPQAARIVTVSNELDLLFSRMFDELLNRSTQVVSKSSTVTTVDAPIQCQQQHTTPLNTQTTPEPTCQDPTQAPTVTSTENINQAKTIIENAQVEDDEFINIFCTSVQDRGETSSHHPLEQVIGNPSQSVRTRRQLESDGEMCMFSLTVSRTEPKNIKEAMADSAWIESMQEELHLFDRLDIWELVDRPLYKNVINMKWLWKNKRDEENIVICNKSHLVAKGFAQKGGVDLKNHLHELLS